MLNYTREQGNKRPVSHYDLANNNMHLTDIKLRLISRYKDTASHHELDNLNRESSYTKALGDGIMLLDKRYEAENAYS